MNPSSRVSAWVGSFLPPPRPNHHYHPATPIFRVVVIWFSPVVSFSIQASVWVGSLIVRPHLYHSTAPLFRVCVFLFLGSLNVLAWHGTFLTKHRTLPWPPHRPRRECDQSIPHIGLDGLICLSFRPTTTIRSTPPTKRKPRTFHAGHRLGWPRPPLPCLLYTSPSPRDKRQSRMPSSA